MVAVIVLEWSISVFGEHQCNMVKSRDSKDLRGPVNCHAGQMNPTQFIVATLPESWLEGGGALAS